MGHQLVKLGKIEVGLVILDTFMIYWKVQFRENFLPGKKLQFWVSGL